MKNTFLTAILVLLLSVCLLPAQTNQYYLSFDGNDYVKYSNDELLQKLDGATDYTLEAWIYPDTNVQRYDRIFQRYYSFNAVIWHIRDQKDSCDWYFTVYDVDGNSHYFNADTSLVLNAWNHIAIINNSSEGFLRLYVNGQNVSQEEYNNFSFRPAHSSDNLYVGQYGNGTDFFSGYIDEVRFQNVALDISELHYDNHTVNYSADANTAILLHFDEGSGSMTQNSATASGDSARLGGPDTGDDAEPTWVEWEPSQLQTSPVFQPEIFYVAPNFPNPFNPTTTIAFTIPQAGTVHLTVYDIQGRTMLSKELCVPSVGIHRVKVDGSEWNSGIYFSRLTFKGQTITQKMVLTK